MYFKQDGAICTLNDKPIKLINQFTSLGGNISSTESNVNLRIGKAYTAINRLTNTWKSNPSDTIEQEFFQDVAVSELLYGCTTWTLTKR